MSPLFYLPSDMTKKQFDTEFRYDRGTIEILERGDGFLRTRVSIARAGVFPYLTPTGEIRMEAKLPEDIFSEITIRSAKGVPVTDGHPPYADNKGMVNTTNWQKYVKGALGDTIIVRDGLMEAMETIFDAALIADLECGNKVETSIGFRTVVDYTPGEFEGQRYDAKQTDIIINHVAHVEKGRAGESVRAYLDSADGKYAVQIDDNKTTRRDSKMDSKIIEGIKKFLALLGITTDETADKAGADGEKPDKGADSEPGASANEPKGDSDKELEGLKKLVKEQQAKIDALEAVNKKHKDAQVKADEESRIDEAVKKRMGLIDAAKSVVPDFKHDGLSDREIKLAVIGRVLPYDKAVKTDELDVLYIDARFDAAMSLAKEKANITGDTAPEGRIDEAAIEKKKAGRLNVMEEIK